MRAMFVVWVMLMLGGSVSGQLNSSALKGIWRQPELGIVLQMEEHGAYMYGKVVGHTKFSGRSALSLSSDVRPGHFVLQELRPIQLGLWQGIWNNGPKGRGVRSIRLRSLSPDAWQLYIQRGPFWFKLKLGRFVPEK